MSDVAIIGLLIACIVVLFVTDRLPVVVVAMATPLALWATGVLSLEKALSGFGDPAVIFIAALFVVSAGLERSGVTAWAGQLLIAGAGTESRPRLLLLTMLLVALLTALISVNGAVAALLPVVVVMAVRLKRAPSQLLMPLVFSAHAGSLLALTGTPVNVLVSTPPPKRACRAFASSSSRWSACRCCSAPWPSSSCSASACCLKRNGRFHAVRLQQACQDTGRAVRAAATVCSACGSRPHRRWQGVQAAK